jgi:transposase
LLKAARCCVGSGPSLDAAGHRRGEKKKNERVNANKICDYLRCDFLPECYLAPTGIRERQRTLRCRNLLVRQMVQMKIKISTLLMEAGVSYNQQKLPKTSYFREWLPSNPDIDESLRSLLGQCREMVVRLGKMETAPIHSLQQDRSLVERVERLISIPAIGPITALTWALEIGEVQRFSTIKKAISYYGRCGDEQRSANTTQRAPLSKHGNKHLRTTLIEAAKMAPALQPDAGAALRQGKVKRQCQSPHASGGQEVGGLSDGRGSRAVPFLGDRPEDPYRRLRCGSKASFFSARAARSSR